MRMLDLSLPRVIATALTALVALPLVTTGALAQTRGTPQKLEGLWYARNNDESVNSFVANAARISIVSPQVFSMDSTGVIRGSISPRIVAAARANKVKLVPLVMNPGFDLASLHRVLTVPDARATAVRSLAALCRDQHLDGIQFDFENLYVGDRDAFTAFTREASDSVHRAGCTLSAAVVPRTDDDRGVLPYHQWMYDYWRGAYDYKALADTLDFLSYMTYAQHTSGSTPGPVAGYPWMEASLKYVLAAGVPPQKISLGIPSYSDYWFPGYDAKTGSRSRASDIEYTRLMAILDTAHAKPQWDAVQKAWFAQWPRNGVFELAWIEDARAFKAKLELVRKYKLRGYSVWLIGTEDPATWNILGPIAK
jgi:spore germination protein YaaH